MSPEGFLNYNGKIYKNDKLLISPDNRSFRYGDGCFETMKMIDGKIILESYHLERLFTSLQALQFDKPNYFITDDFKEQIVELATKNKHKKMARIRITISRGDGVAYATEDHHPNYLVQTWDLNSSNNKFSKEGLTADIYADARKVSDKYSHIKSNNCLNYALGSLWANEKNLNDVLLLNPYDRIAEGTVGNVFIVQKGVLKTPALSEGCINGVMRRFILKSAREDGMNVEETQISIEDISKASEVFLTNAVYGIRWVKSIGKTQYKTQVASMLHEKFLVPLFV